MLVKKNYFFPLKNYSQSSKLLVILKIIGKTTLAKCNIYDISLKIELIKQVVLVLCSTLLDSSAMLIKTELECTMYNFGKTISYNCNQAGGGKIPPFFATYLDEML